ncbi:MAG: hypothetical protein JNJ47_05795, partial [Alphaproteobacteria bacterium]|nr:hypothetical protein [Alphaproteobacteria bacterium]
HFLSTRREKEIRVLPESVREEVRAEELLRQKKNQDIVSHLHHEHLHLDVNDFSQKEALQMVSETITKDLFVQREVQKLDPEIISVSKQNREEQQKKATFWQIIKDSFKGNRMGNEASCDKNPDSISSEKSKLFLSHNPTALEKDTSRQLQSEKEYHMADKFKEEILGEKLYQKIATKNLSHIASQVISEELKREMLGDKFYNRNYKKIQTSNTKETNKLSRIYMLSRIEEEHAHHEQDISLSQKPTSRGRKR